MNKPSTSLLLGGIALVGLGILWYVSVRKAAKAAALPLPSVQSTPLLAPVTLSAPVTGQPTPTVSVSPVPGDYYTDNAALDITDLLGGNPLG